MVLDKLRNSILLVLAWLSLLAGVVGIFLPILPTTPFVLLSAYLFSKSSKKCHRWLVEHEKLGPLITDWEKDGVIRTKSKVLAISLITVMFTISIFILETSLIIKSSLALIGLLVSVFIATRPGSAVKNIK